MLAVLSSLGSDSAVPKRKSMTLPLNFAAGLLLYLIPATSAERSHAFLSPPLQFQLKSPQQSKQRPEQREYVAAVHLKNTEKGDDVGMNDNGRKKSSTSHLGSSVERELKGLQSAGITKRSMEPGDLVVCKRSIPELGIYENKGYELVSVYAQKFDPETQMVNKLELRRLDADAGTDAVLPAGYDQLYVTLYSPAYHKDGNPVVVTPAEAGLTSVRSEFIQSLYLAIPGAFWLLVCYAFYSSYHERTGGDFLDAFWGR